MAIIVVGGSAKGVGKTTLVCGLIAALDSLRWSAVKVTTDAHQGVPTIYEEKSAGPEADTARYLAAGAERAFILTVPPERDLTEALDEFWPRVDRGANLIFESNRVMGQVTSDACLLVRGDPREGRDKSSYSRVAQLADAVVVRSTADQVSGGDPGANEPTRPLFHLRQFERISAEMKCWLEKRPGLGT
jgi:hypothetical protein